MESNNIAPKEPSRIPRKPERTYTSSLKSCPMETRRRPLRTYSKRVAPTESSEPVAKRQCLPAPSITPIQNEEIRKAPTAPENMATTSAPKSSTPSLPPIKKGTITAYFSRAAPPPPTPVVTSSSSDPPSEPLSEPNEIITTPPSSPPIITATKRKIRRLKTRAVSRRIFEKETGDMEKGEGHDEEEKHAGETSETNNEESPLENPTSVATLSEIAPNSLNRPEKEGSQSQQSKRKREKQKKTPSVQTTLSLSMREEALYTECKECGMLYNHLHQADVKYHARRHAALLKAKAQAEAEDVAEDEAGDEADGDE